MYTTSTIFNTLVASEEKTIRVKTATLREHENLRCSLSKLFSKHKQQMEDLGYLADDEKGKSICAEWKEGVSTFKVAVRRTEKTYELVG